MLEQLAAPTVYPVSLATAKDWLRETTADNDAVITQLIKDATERAETVSKNALVARPVREQFDYFLPYFELSGYPVLGVRSITYLDSSGVKQTWPLANTRIDRTKGQARITPEYALYFPPTRVIMNSVQITYDIGRIVPVTAVDAAGDILTAPGHYTAADDMVQLSTDGGTLPGGVAAGTVYYSKVPVGDTLQLAAAAGGAAIDLLAGYAAPVFLGMLPNEFKRAIALLIDSWFRNRSDVSPNQVWQMPGNGAADNLLMSFMPRGF